MIKSEMDNIYKNIPPDKIPWNIERPPKALVELIKTKNITPCKVIDLGCGAGNYAIYLAEQGFDVTGIDISEEALVIARNKAREKLVKCTFLTADLIGNLGVAGGNYDFAYDWELLHHIFPEKRKTFAENVHKLLGPSALYYSVCFSEKDPHFGGCGRYRKTPLGTVLYFSSENELKALFEPFFIIEEAKIIEISGKVADHLACSVFMRKK